MKRIFFATVLFISVLPFSAAPMMRSARPTAVTQSSLFWKFGGNGADGWHTVTGNEILNDVTRQYANLTIPEGTTLTVNNVFAYIAVQGTCTIEGTIDADGRGAPGTESSFDDYDKQFLLSGLNAESNYGSAPVGSCVTGAGGGGVITGGGAGSHGGYGSAPNSENAKFTPLQKIIGVSGGSSGNNDGKSLTDDFGPLVAFPGAAGGFGFPGIVPGGNGGGVIYVECGTLIFSGNLTANGTNGANSSQVGGGGGGGGAILVRAQHILSKSGKVSVKEGLGGSGGARNGGNGAPGFVDIVNMQ